MKPVKLIQNTGIRFSRISIKPRLRWLKYAFSQIICIAIAAAVSPKAVGQRASAVKTMKSIVYHGKLVGPEGKAVNGQFSLEIKIYSPEPNLCLLWSETQSITIENGGFSAEVGYDSNRSDGPNGGVAETFSQVFDNNTGLSLPNAQCAVGNTYSPGANDDRLIYATFTQGDQVIQVAGLPVKAVPFALQAEAVSGYRLSNLMKISGVGSNVVFSPDEVQSLKNLLGGNVIWNSGNKRISSVADPVDAGDAVNKQWVQNLVSASSGISDGAVTTSKIADTAVTSGKIADDAVTFDKFQNVNSGVMLGRSSVGSGSVEEITLGAGLVLSGGVLNTVSGGTVTNVTSGNAYLSVVNGTTTPALTVNVGQAANTVAAGDDARIVGALQKSGGTMSGVLNMGSNDISAAGNINLSDDKLLKLGSFVADPSTAGWGNAEKGRAWFNTTSNQMKYWDGSGAVVLSSVGASVTSVTASSPLSSNGGTTPVISIAQSGAAADGYLSSADWNTFNNKQNALGFTPVSSALADGKILVGNAGDVATAVTPSGDVTMSNAGAMSIGAGKVLTSMIADGNVTTAKIADSNITLAKLAADSVNSSKVVDDSLSASDLDFEGAMAVNTGLVVRDGTKFHNKTCAANQTLIWTVANGWLCNAVVLSESDPKVGVNTTNMLSKWDGSALVASGVFESSGNVGIGTTSPAANAKLTVAGSIATPVSTFSGSFTCGSSSLDFSGSNFLILSPSNTIAAGSCAVTLSNLSAGGSYTLVVKGNAATNAVTYAFSGYTFKYLPANAATTAAKDTIYTFLYDGTSVYVTWSGGY